MLTVDLQSYDGISVLSCVGKIVRGSELSLLCAAVGEYGREVLLDLAGVDDIDDAGRGALLALQAAGVYLRLLNPTHAVLNRLKSARLESLFEISEPVAVAAGTR